MSEEEDRRAPEATKKKKKKKSEEVGGSSSSSAAPRSSSSLRKKSTDGTAKKRRKKSVTDDDDGGDAAAAGAAEEDLRGGPPGSSKKKTKKKSKKSSLSMEGAGGGDRDVPLSPSNLDLRLEAERDDEGGAEGVSPAHSAVSMGAMVQDLNPMDKGLNELIVERAAAQSEFRKASAKLREANDRVHEAAKNFLKRNSCTQEMCTGIEEEGEITVGSSTRDNVEEVWTICCGFHLWNWNRWCRREL